MSSSPLLLRPGNPMGRVQVSVVAFEVIVFGLATFVLIRVSGVPVGQAIALCGVAALVALAAAATMRRPLGQWLGWLSQVLGVALGIWAPVMFLMGGFFALLWVVTVVLGKRLEAQGVLDR